MRDLPEWVEESAEILVDGEASISEAAGPREPSIPEPRTKVESEKHHVFTPFPKDRNREVSRRTKFTRCPCRKRTCNQIPRAENFGDFIKADPNVLNEECESRNSHRYAVIVQDLATQCLQACLPTQNKDISGNERASSEFSRGESQSESDLHR